MTKDAGLSLGWKLRDALTGDPRWRADMLSLARPMDLAFIETRPRRHARGIYLQTMTLTPAKPFAMITVEVPASARETAAVTKIDASLRASGYDGSWARGESRIGGCWMRGLRGIREAVEELSRTGVPSTQTRAPNVQKIRGRDALLEAARAGAFGPMQFSVMYSCEESLRGGRTPMTLRLGLSANDEGVGFAFTSAPVRVAAADRSAIATQLGRLKLDATWTRVPSAGFMLSGGLPMESIGKPRTSIEEVVDAASSLRRWAKDGG